MTSLEFWYPLNRGYRAHNVPEKRFQTSFCARNEVFWLILESLFFFIDFVLVPPSYIFLQVGLHHALWSSVSKKN